MSERIATVVAVTGKAYARNAEGLSRPLEAGDVLREGETVVTSPGGRVELALGNGEVVHILPEQSVLISAEMSAEMAASADEAAVTADAVDRVVQALESGRDPFDELEAPAAGLAGGGAGDGNDFVRLLRITEEVDPLALQFDQAATIEDPTIVGATGNQAPLVVDDSTSTEPGRTVEIDVLANDSDPDGDPLAIVAVAGEPISVDEPVTLPEGVVSLNPDGTLSFAPNAGFEGELSFEYTVSDGNSLASGQVSVTVDAAAADSQPLAVDDSATTTVGTSVSGNLAANDSPSLDGGNVWALVDAPDNGSVIVNADGTYTYTPGTGFTGEDRFSYSITDADGDVSIAEVTVTVVDGSSPPPADDAPVAVDDSVAIEVDEIAFGNLADNDTPSDDGGNVWALQTPPENGTAVVDADGSFRYTPDAGFSGRDSFTYTVTDIDGDVSTATVFIAVGVADSVPIAQDDEFTVQTGTTFEGDLAENDTPSADGGNVWAISQLAGGGEVVVNADGTFSYTPDEGYFGIDSFTYTVTDIDGDVSTGTVIIDVVDTDGVPTAVDDSFSTDQDVAFDGDLAANDEASPDGGNVWSLISGPANGTVVINEDGSFTYTPDEGFSGTDSFFYRVADADGDDSTATATITVNSTNTDPEAVDDGPLSTDEDTPLTGIDVLGNDTDADGDPLTVTSATSPDGTVTINPDGSLDFTPNADFNGPTTIQYTIDDGNGGSDTAIVTINVAPVNDAPVAEDDTGATQEDVPVTFTAAELLANDSDVDGDALTITAVGPSTNGTAVLNADGSVTFTPTTDFNGTASFVYTVEDGNGGSDTATVTITVPAQNDAPIAVDDGPLSTDEDTPLTGINVLGNDTDADGDPLTVTSASSPDGTVTINPDGSLDFTPNTDFNGPTTIQYTIDDGNGGTDTATVTINVAPVNDDPVAEDDTGATQEDVPVTFTAAELLANDSDVDGDALTITSVGTSTNGVAVLNADGSVTFTPELDFTGTASFEYTVEDGNGGIDTATVTIEIPTANDAPIAVDDGPLSTNEDTPLTGIDVLGNDTDADGDPLTVTSASSPDGTVTINPDGSLDFTPNADFNGPTTIQYTIDDGNGGSDTATVTINVAPVNDAPVAGGSVAGVEDVPLVLSWADFGVSDVDSPPGAMSIEIASLPADGRLEVLVGANWTPVAIGQSISNATIDSGALRFVPAADESGSDVFGGTGTGDQQADYAVFDFVAHDGQGAETAGTLIIDIQPVADQPSLALGPTVVDPTTDHFFLPAGTGLALDRFDNVATLDPASAADADVLESTLAALTPDASSVVMDLGSGNTAATAVDVPLDAAFRLTGLIYLESGHSYTLSGYRDDTFHVEIGGQVLISDGHNTWGSYATAAFTPTETGYYTIEAYVYNGDGVGDVSVLVSTDGGTPQPLSAHATFTDVAAVASAGGQLSEFVGGADGGYYPVRRNEGLEDTPIQLQGISAALADNDGSEALTLSIGSLPDGSVLSDGSNSFVASAGATTADVTGWDVEGLQITAPPGFTGSFTLDVSATSTESSTGQAATTTLPLVVTVLDVDRAPSIAGATVRVSEEGLADGIADAIGVPVDAGDSAVASGAMLLSNPDNDPISVSLSAPAASLTSAGQPVSWSGDGTSTLIGSANGSEVIRVSVAADGSYTVSLAAALDHSGVGIEDVLEFNVGVTISDGTGSSTAPLRVVVEDDAPGVATTTAAVHVAVDEIVVSGLEAGWTNAVFINGTNQVTRINNDADAYNDAVMWGRPASGSGQSGYVLDDDDVLASAGGRQVQAGESFVIAEFSHLNWPVYSNSSLLDSVTLNIDMQVAINGVAYPVSFEVLVDHEETPNNGADPRDIITLPAQSVTVNVGGQDYEIRLDGFVDGNGNVVNVIRTDEQASNEFSIVGSIVSNDPLPTVSGNVFAEAGADGSAVGVAWGNTASSNGVLQTGPDGSYQFIVDRDVRESLEPGQTLTETFGYTITDRDGDSQNGTLVVRISGHQRVDGTSGGDNLVGGGEDELLSGFAGSDQIDGGGGNDVLIGGAGDDDMSGGIGADVFVWELADRGAAGNPAQDTISDFDTAASSDALDLRDLLQGESHGIDGGNLGDYLHFESSGADTIVHVSSNGGFSSGYSSAQEDVSITLQGVDLFSGGLSTDQQVIQDLLSKGKLITD